MPSAEDPEKIAVLAGGQANVEEGEPVAPVAPTSAEKSKTELYEANFIALMMKLKPDSNRSDLVKSKTACVAASIRMMCAVLSVARAPA